MTRLFSPGRSDDRSVTDTQLMLAAAGGHEAAFDHLFARHRDGLRGFLRRRLRNAEDVEDAITLTFFHAWRARESFRGESTAKAWLYQIASRVVLDQVRRRMRRPDEQELDVLPEGCATWDDRVVDPEEEVLQRSGQVHVSRCISQALKRLTEAEQRLIALFYLEERSYEEIAAHLGLPRSQVRGRLHRIRHRLRFDLQERQGWAPA